MHFMHELFMACEGDLYTLDTAAARLGLSKWLLLNHIGLGNSRFINVGSGSIPITVSLKRCWTNSLPDRPSQISRTGDRRGVPEPRCGCGASGMN